MESVPPQKLNLGARARRRDPPAELPAAAPAALPDWPAPSLVRTYGKGQWLPSGWLTPASAVTIVAGDLRLYAATAGGQLVADLELQTGDVFGLGDAEHALAARSRARAHDGPSIVHHYPRADLLRLAESNLALAAHLRERTWAWLNDALARLELLPGTRVRDRLLARLIHLAGVGGVVHETHEELAAHINTSREEVSKALSHLDAEGLIRCHYSRITVLNHECLEDLCE